MGGANFKDVLAEDLLFEAVVLIDDFLVGVKHVWFGAICDNIIERLALLLVVLYI